MDPAEIMRRLQEIEDDLATRQNDFELAAKDKHRLEREYELRLARGLIASDKDTVAERKADALVQLAVAGDGIYEEAAKVEGAYQGLRAAIKVLETRATIGQSLLKAMGRV